jgi:hypothetical protein
MTELNKIHNYLFKKFDKLTLYIPENMKFNPYYIPIMSHDINDYSINIIEIINKYQDKYIRELLKYYIEKQPRIHIIFGNIMSKEEFFNLYIKNLIIKIYNFKYNMFINEILDIIKKEENEYLCYYKKSFIEYW